MLAIFRDCAILFPVSERNIMKNKMTTTEIKATCNDWHDRCFPKLQALLPFYHSQRPKSSKKIFFIKKSFLKTDVVSR